jgi:hypothetical protein
MTQPTTCDCCPPAGDASIQAATNPPGLDSIANRIATQSRFKRAMLESLASQSALSRLSSRSDDDPGIALIDAWACTLDVLTFYQERIANEGYLRTASERRSVLELARAIGYELRPGVAASTDLAFTLETAPGAPLRATIGAGTKVQSIPAQNQRAQIFETLAPIEARAAWNALRLPSTEPIRPWSGPRDTIYLRGQATQLQKGDPLLIVDGESPLTWHFFRVREARVVPPAEPTSDGAGGYTVVVLDSTWSPISQSPRVYALRTRARIFGNNAPDWRAMPIDLRATYLGINPKALDANGGRAGAEVAAYAQWPGFSPAALSDPPAGTAVGTGLRGEYYAGMNFEEWRCSRIDASINFDWSGGSPDYRVPADAFSVRWSGWLETKSGGSYVFQLLRDDGVRLWVDDTLIFDQWNDHGVAYNNGTPVWEESSAIELAANRKYKIRLEFYEHGGSAVAKLNWKPPGEAQSAVPTSRLYPADIYDLKLDAAYPKITSGSWVVITAPGGAGLYRVAAAGESACADFAFTAKTSWLKLDGSDLYEKFDRYLRETVLFGEADELSWADHPVSGLVSGLSLVLTTKELDLAPQQRLAVSGLVPAPGSDTSIRQRLDNKAELSSIVVSSDGTSAVLRFAGDAHDVLLPLAAAAEVSTIRSVGNYGATTVMGLDRPLANSYLPMTLRVNANVAPASHGDSRQMRSQAEVLGSGSGAMVFQVFDLKQAPLTYVSAATANGTQSTLQVRIGGVAWSEVPSLFQAAPDARVFVTRMADDGTVTVRFGDGVTGARLPSGTENVQAGYRVGIGTSGNLDAGQISLLLTPQLGVKSALNPGPATGGTDPENIDRARRNAPLTVLTLDRIVSLSDFEGFAAAFTGIGKARAEWLWSGDRRLVHVSVAAVGGGYLPADSPTLSNLRAAIDAARPAHQDVTIAVGQVTSVLIYAGVRVRPGYEFASVAAQVRTRLVETFGFDVRDFTQPLSGSELVAAMQAAPGVDHVSLYFFYAGGRYSTLLGDPIEAAHARWLGTRLMPAEMLVVAPAGINLTELNA